MYVVLLGAPGVGKGTQAKVLEVELGIPHVSTGDMLRSASKAGSDLGKRVQEVMDSGGLVSDEIILALVRERLQAPDAARGALLDGFPRTAHQAEVFLGMVKLRRVVSVEVPEEDIVRRLAGRATCGSCGSTFHVDFGPSLRVANACDKCGGALNHRPDDEVDAVRHRLAVYHESTEPLVGFYEQRGLLSRVDGRGSLGEVTARIRAAITG
jgi:adenylate kinase